MKKRTSTCLSLMFAAGLFVAGVSPLHAQGMISAPGSLEDVSDIDLGGLANMAPQEISTVQRLLRRLGYLNDQNMTREMDAETIAAIAAHIKKAKIVNTGLTSDIVMRSLFSTVWKKEGWATGGVKGQDQVVDPPDVLATQEALKKLGYAPGPVDSVFGPATFSAIEIFQEDNGMNVTGLLTRNIQHNITRAVKFIKKPPASVIHVYNWADYIDPTILDDFEKETNIRVVHDEFQNSSETKELLEKATDKYDVIFQDGTQMRQILETPGAVEELDPTKLPNVRELDPAILKMTDVLDPGNTHSVPYFWGTLGLGVNKDKVQKIRPDAPLNSLALMLDPKYAADLSKCGIAMIDETTDVLPAFVAYKGGDPADVTITDIEELDRTLAKVAPYIKIISVDSYIDSVADGKYCVVFGYSGDTFEAREAAKEKKTGTIVYNVPKEGGLLWFDLIVIPGQSKNKDAAYQFLNYMLKPEVAAASTNYLQYANPVLASAKLIDPKLMKDPGLYPPQSVMKRLAIQPPLAANVETELGRIWSKLNKEQLTLQ
jgi:putrescine transport system substrate-binding protein